MKRISIVLFFITSIPAAWAQAPKWSTTGNAAASGDFLGTTNNEPLLLKTNNTTVAKFHTNGNLTLNNYSGSGTAFMLLNGNGLVTRYNFSGNATDVFTGAGTFAPLSSIAGWQFSGLDLNCTAGGNVGIGTFSPAYKLDVNGDIRSSGKLIASGLEIVDDVKADTVKSHRMISVNNNLMLESAASSEFFATTGNLFIQCRTGIAGNTYINAGVSGNVGIGANVAQYKLDVTGQMRVTDKILTQRITPLPGDTFVMMGDSTIFIGTANNIWSSTTGTRKGLGIGNGSTYAKGLNALALGYRSFAFGNGSVTLGSMVSTQPTANNSIVIGSGILSTLAPLTASVPQTLSVGFNSDRPTLYVTPSAGAGTVGKVGIGTTDPAALLQVGDGAYGITMGEVKNQSPNFNTAYLGFNLSRNPSSGQWQSRDDVLNFGGVLFLTDANGKLRIINMPANGGNGTATYTESQILDNARLTIDADGRVIIGKEQILSGLHANSFTKLTVDGKIVAKEVWVTLDGWADDVFEAGYKLMPIPELDSYIQTNGHLPGVPTTKDILANGSDLGKNDAILLRKVEELTLYMLELKKENQVMAGRLRKLETDAAQH